MKVLHICISAPYIDGWGYQENLLPKYLQNMGHRNYVVASSSNFPTYLKQKVREEIKAKGLQYNFDGIEVRRIPSLKISSSFVIPKNLHVALDDIRPDVIFHHNFNSTSLPIAARYAKKHCIPMVVDNHADIINMSGNKLWRWFFYKFLIRITCKICQNQIYKSYGVTRSRCEFIQNYYGIPSNKIDFLPIGADVDLADTISTKEVLREKYGFSDKDFVVVSGGKMGKGKGTDILMCAVKELQDAYPQLRLVLFGKFEDRETQICAEQSKKSTVVGWCNRIKTLEVLKMADVACWPIHHTTLIEDAVSVCTPIIIRKTGTTSHLIGDNGIWIEKGTRDEIKSALIQLLGMAENRPEELLLGCKKMKETISYHVVAKKFIEDISTFNK